MSTGKQELKETQAADQEKREHQTVQRPTLQNQIPNFISNVLWIMTALTRGRKLHSVMV